MNKVLLISVFIILSLASVTFAMPMGGYGGGGYGGGGGGGGGHGLLIITKHTSYEKGGTKVVPVPMSYPVFVPMHHHGHHYGHHGHHY